MRQFRLNSFSLIHRVAPSGFTLLEVLIALTILAVLSVLTTQAIRSALKNREWLSADIDRDARLADAVRIISNDLRKAFHHRDIFTKMYNEIVAPSPPPAGQTTAGNSGTNPNQPPAGPTPISLGTPKPIPPELTGFSGSANAVHFTALSNVRTLRDIPESAQAKIGYYLSSCRSRAEKKSSGGSCLMRSITPVLDDDLTKPGSETVLAENVEEFKLRYFASEKDEPVEAWRSGKDGDSLTKDRFPDAVEFTLTLHDKSDPKDKTVTATVLVALDFPNNPPLNDPESSKK